MLSVGVGTRLGTTLALLTGAQVVVSFGLQAYVVARLGAGTETDAFYAASTLSQIVAGIAIDPVGPVLVPILSLYSERDVRAQGWMMTFVAAVGFTLVAVLLAGVASWLMPIMVAGFSDAGKDLTVRLTRIQLLGLGGAACTAVLTSTYQVRGRFVLPLLAALGAGLLACALVGARLERSGIAAAAWGQVLATSGPAAVLLVGLGVPQVGRWQPHLLLQLAGRLRPLVLSRVCFLTTAPIDRLLASFLAPGSLMMLELVTRFYAAAQRVLAQGAIAPLQPHLSRLAGSSQWREFRRLYRQQTAAALTLSVLVVVGVEVVAYAALHWWSTPTGVVAGRLMADDLRRFAWLAACLSGLLPCLVLSNALNNAFYAQGDTRTPARVALLAYGVGVGGRIAGFMAGGIEGLALAVTAWAVLYCWWLFRSLGHRTAERIHDAGSVDASVPLLRGLALTRQGPSQ